MMNILSQNNPFESLKRKFSSHNVYYKFIHQSGESWHQAAYCSPHWPMLASQAVSGSTVYIITWSS